MEKKIFVYEPEQAYHVMWENGVNFIRKYL